MNIDRRYVVDCEPVISAVVDLLSPFYFNLYNHKNTTDVLFDNDNDSYRAKCKQSVLKTALTLEVYNCEGSRWLVHNLKTQKY